MAIKRSKDDASKPALPAQLASMLLEAFSFQAIKDMYEDAFKGSKKNITTYLEHNTDGFEVDLGKGFKCEQGTVIYTQRDNWKYDVDKIIEMIEKGEVTLATVLNNVSGFKAAFKETLGSKFEDIATNSPTEYLTLRGNAEFKEECEAKFGSMIKVDVDAELPKVEKKAEVKKDVKDSVAKAKAAAKAAAKPAKAKVSKSADDDLDAILNDGE